MFREIWPDKTGIVYSISRRWTPLLPYSTESTESNFDLRERPGVGCECWQNGANRKQEDGESHLRRSESMSESTQGQGAPVVQGGLCEVQQGAIGALGVAGK